MITNFSNYILEFNRKDLNLITSEEISEKFTIAFELELETDDPSIKPIIHEQDLIDEIREKLFSLLKNEKVDYSEKVFFIEEVTNSIDFDDEDETLDNILDWELYKDKKEQIIVYYLNILYQDIYERVEDERSNESYEELYLKILTDKAKEHLPNFYKKYKNEIDFVMDMTLDKGLEIKQKTYIKGLNKSIIFLNDFFEDFKNQTYWKFTKKTGLHINIGFVDDNVQWNIVKGVILLKDIKKDDIPFVYKDMIWRMNTHFTDSIFNQLKINKSKIDLSDIETAEKYIQKSVESTMKKFGSKHFGFNISKLKSENYIEFRYVGGVVDKELIISKMLYFCYIVYLMINPLYKRKEYLKSLYKFVDEL